MSFSTAFASAPTEWDEDKATLSNYQEVRTDHIDLDWSIDWKKQVIHGGAQLRMTATKDIETVVLDSSYLDIQKVSVDGTEVKWSHGERIGAMGEGLKIELKDQFKAGQVSRLDENGFELISGIHDQDLLLYYQGLHGCRMVEPSVGPYYSLMN